MYSNFQLKFYHLDGSPDEEAAKRAQEWTEDEYGRSFYQNGNELSDMNDDENGFCEDLDWVEDVGDAINAERIGAELIVDFYYSSAENDHVYQFYRYGLGLGGMSYIYNHYYTDGDRYEGEDFTEDGYLLERQGGKPLHGKFTNKKTGETVLFGNYRIKNHDSYLEYLRDTLDDRLSRTEEDDKYGEYLYVAGSEEEYDSEDKDGILSSFIKNAKNSVVSQPFNADDWTFEGQGSQPDLFDVAAGKAKLLTEIAVALGCD